MLSVPLNKTFPSYIIFLRHVVSQDAISNKISNILICFCNFDLSCPILNKYSFIKKKVYCLVLFGSLTLFVSILFIMFFTIHFLCCCFQCRRPPNLTQYYLTRQKIWALISQTDRCVFKSRWRPDSSILPTIKRLVTIYFTESD